jgi:hypothetical protein
MASCTNCKNAKPAVSGSTIRLYCEPFRQTFTHMSPGSQTANLKWHNDLRDRAEKCARFEAEC